MATTTTVQTSFNGQLAGGIISESLFKASSLENGIVTIKSNVKYKQILKRLATGSLLQADSCDFDASSTVDYDERELEVKALKVNLQLCKDDFMDDYEALSMGDSAHKNFPKSFAEYLVQYVQGRVAQETEVAIWQGNGGANTIAGFEGLFVADATVIDVAGIAADASTILVELQKVVDAIPTAVLKSDDLRLIVSSSVERAYITALGGFGANGLGANGVNGQGTNQAFSGLMFGGIKMVVANGLTEGNIVASRISNLNFGTSLMSDMNLVKTIDMSPIDGSDNVRFIMKMQAGVQYAYGAEIVYYAI
tara:strand:+ start:1514 stop:2437 length:924 start_codon:yes stop_codon:yes gene_type:complete